MNRPDRQASLISQFLKILVSLGILVGGFAVMVLAAKLKSEPPDVEPDEQTTRVLTARVAVYEEGLYLEADGTVVPFREIQLANEVGGRVKFKAAKCRAGHAVREGTLLFEIDPVDYSLEVRRLEKELDQNQASLEEAAVEMRNTEALIGLAERDLELQLRDQTRLETLAKSRVTAEAEVDQARRAVLSAKNALQKLHNQVRSIGAQQARIRQLIDFTATRLEKAQLDLKRTKVMSPIDGVIVQELVEEDAYVQPGTPLVEIEDTSSVDVRCNLRRDQLFWIMEAFSGQIAAGEGSGYELPQAPVQIMYDVVGRRYVWEARLSHFDGIGLEPKTRTIPCRIVVDNPRGGRLVQGEGNASARNVVSTRVPVLVRGMFVTARINISSESQLLRIPGLAVRPGNFVWCVRDGAIEKVPIEVVQTVGNDDALIYSEHAPLRLGDQIVTSPLPGATAGMPVKVEAAQ